MAYYLPWLSNSTSGGSFTDTEQNLNVPTYVSALADYEVKRLTSVSNAKATLNDTMPVAWQGATGGTYGNNINIMRAFSGGTWDGPGAYLYIHGGGHSDSANNGIWRFNYNGDTQPTGWELLDITPAPADMTADADPVSSSPSRPVSIHTYSGLCFDPDTNKVFRFAGSRWSGGAMPSHNWAFNCNDNTWAQTQDTPYGANTSVCSVLDPVNRKALVIAHSGDWWFYRIDTNAQGATGSDDQQAFDSVAAYDATRSRAVIWAPSELWLVEIDWVAETTTWSAITASGSTSFLSVAPGAFFYDWDSDVYWFFPLVEGSTSMTNVYSMNPTTWAITSHATSGNNSGFDTDGGWDGSYNKICFMSQWRAVGFATGINDEAYVIKLPIV